MATSMIGQRISLNEVEQVFCRSIAQLRHRNNRKEGVENRKLGDQSDEATDLEGIGSEFAFCKLFNLYPDLTIEPRSSKNDSGDVIFPGGQTVDVKATRYPTGKLIAVPWKQSNVDYYALVVGMFPDYQFKGFMAKEELIRPERLGDLGHGPTYIAEQRELVDL